MGVGGGVGGGRATVVGHRRERRRYGAGVLREEGSGSFMKQQVVIQSGSWALQIYQEKVQIPNLLKNCGNQLIQKVLARATFLERLLYFQLLPVLAKYISCRRCSKLKEKLNFIKLKDIFHSSTKQYMQCTSTRTHTCICMNAIFFRKGD
jgi:hypothetical protein